MTQQSTPRLKPAVAMATFCVTISIVCNLPQVLSLGSECYTITGVDYRGTQDKIDLPPSLTGADLIESTYCLPWNSSIESRKPRARERGIGNHNHCRNPDGDILPWCKVPGVAGSDGAWGYCHLPTCGVPGYLGCFPDKGQPTALDAVNIVHKSTTVGACLSFCRKLGYRYAGLEAGHACYCGNGGYNRYGSPAERGTHCSSKCFGNKGQPCGGDGYVDVYKSDIGSCGTVTPLNDPNGAVYSPGYPDFPGGTGFMTSLNAADAMMTKLKEKLKDEEQSDKLESEIDEQADNNAAQPQDEPCIWNIEVKHAINLKMLVRKIDPKRKLGGAIEIEASDGAHIIISVPSQPVTSSSTSDDKSSNATNPPPMMARTERKSTIVWISDSLNARGEVDVIVPDDEKNQKWSEEMAKSEDVQRYVLPSNTLQPMISSTGGRITVRFLRSPEMVTSVKAALDVQRQKTRSRKKVSGSEWSRFVLEYEATMPEGVTYEPDDVINGNKNGDETNSNGSRRKNKSEKGQNGQDSTDQNSRPRSRLRNSFTAEVLHNEHGKTHLLISQADAKAIKEAITSAGEDGDSDGSDGAGSPLKIEVFVEPVGGEGSEDSRGSNNKQTMSEFTIPLLLAVLLTTTAILILSAVLVFFRRGGISGKKQEKRHDIPNGLIVDCSPGDGGRGLKKTSSDSNLSSSSTTDSLLLTDSDASKYSPRLRRDNSPPVSPTTIKNLMEILKGHPGILNRSPLDTEQYKQISQHAPYMGFNSEGGRCDIRPDDATPLPGPCPYCCGCAEDNRGHRHGDSCRSHHNQGKLGRPGNPQIGSSARASGSKNPRGLTIRGCLKANPASGPQGISLAPPLSPISEVSSVTSSMMSLPITSSNSQTSLLTRHNQATQNLKNNPHKCDKKELMVDLGSETESFLAVESDAESGIGDMKPPSVGSSLPLMNRVTKLRFSDNVSEKMVQGRYLGGVSGACYDSGYATSNYEEEDEDKSGGKRENKNYLSLTKSDMKPEMDLEAELGLINP